MRSPRGFAGSVVLVAGVALALAVAITFNAGGSEIVHIALGLGFLLLASAVFDFRLPRAVNWIAATCMTVLALIFLAQAVADLTRSPAVSGFAYGVLGQYFERALGYVFLIWCIVLALRDSVGWTRLFGFVAIAIALAVDLYGYVVPDTGELKLLTLLVFVWLILECIKPRTT